MRQLRRSVIVVGLTLLVSLCLPAGAGATASRFPTAPKTHRDSSGACLVSGGTQGYPLGNRPLLVGAHPTGVAVVWLPGLNATTCKATVTVGTSKVADDLALDIDQAPLANPGVVCPNDDGSAAVLYVTFKIAPTEMIHISLDGCGWITMRGTAGRMKTAQLASNLLPLAPPMWRTYLVLAT